LPALYDFKGRPVVITDIADGDSEHAGSELAELFSFRTRGVLIKHFHSLVANSADLEVPDPFSFVEEQLRSSAFLAR